MAVPEPALAPVTPPLIDPTVQIKVLGAEAVNGMFVVEPLQIVAVAGVVTSGVALTLTVIVKGVPAQEPATEVGVTI